jgi:hypothetical protein
MALLVVRRAGEGGRVNWHIRIGHGLQLVSTALLALSVGWWSLLAVAVFVGVNLYAEFVWVKRAA